MTMTPQQWNRVKTIVMEAMDLKPMDRAGYVARACEGDTKVWREADSLLRADEGSVLPPPEDGGGVATLPEAGGSMLVGRRVGRYRITRLIGMGGMGAVYEATREDLARPVALKVMRAGLVSSAATARFQREAKMLSRLEHPGIARIYDSGMHESELGPIPYFAMELIPEGVPLTEYARAQGLSIRERVAMFVGVCDAVHHGHQRGVIHRDLKPSNILVSGSARVGATRGVGEGGDSTTTLLTEVVAKVIDFGIARSTDADMTLASFESSPSAMAGTLAYMSPEQCAFDPADLDTMSDVYGLGVVLYELLVGRLPYEVGGLTLPRAIEVIQGTAAARPSQIEPRLGGDLSVILLKCLAKEREQRYTSASELGADLRRWLADLPIAARPASRMYAVRLFAKRNRPLVVASGVAVVAVMMGLVGTSVALYRAVRERDRAQRVAGFLQEVLRSTSAPMVGSRYRDAEISPITARSTTIASRPAAWSRADSVRDVVERARASLRGGALGDARLASELRMLTLQLLITQLGTSEQNRELMENGPREVREAAGVIGATHPSVLGTTLMLSSMMAGTEEASSLVREAYASAKRELGTGDARTLEVGRQLISLLRRDEDAAERRRVAEELVRHAREAHGERSRVTQACRLQAAGATIADGGVESAAGVGRAVMMELGPGVDETDDLMRTAMELSLVDVPRVPATRENLSHIAEVQEKILRGVRVRSGGDARATFDAATALVRTLVQMGEFDRAAGVMRDVAEESRRGFGATFHVTSKSESRVARLLVWGRGDLDEALRWAETASTNSVAGSGSPGGDYEVFDRATVYDVRRARGEAAAALEGIDRLIREYQASSGGHLSWFGGYLHGIAAECLEALGRTDAARERWATALREAEEEWAPGDVLRIVVERGAALFLEKHGPEERARDVSASLSRQYLGPR